MSKTRIDYIGKIIVMTDIDGKTVDEVKESSKHITEEITDVVKDLTGGVVEVTEMLRDVHEVE